MNVNDVLIGHSKAMYSTWFFFKSDALLFDCGEGCAAALNSRVFGIDTIFLSHGHLDHLMGLPGLVFARSAAKGDKAKPLQVVHPAGDPDIPRLKDFIANSFRGPHALQFPLTWHEVRPGDTVKLSEKRSVNVFPTRHDEARVTVGYELVEFRKKLKYGLTALPGEQIKAMADRGEDIFDIRPRRVLVYTGDTTVQDLEVFEDAELVMHEATFLNKEDVKYDSHSLLEDVLKIMAKRQPKELLLMHFSTRYSPAMCGAAVRTKAKELNLTFTVYAQYGEHCWKAFDPQDEESGSGPVECHEGSSSNVQ